jgi:hypothetical protein
MYNEYGVPISFYIAEVIEIITDVNIRCKMIFPDPNCPPVDIVKPVDINSKKIPLLGEHVLIFRGYANTSNVNQLLPEWYYLSIISTLNDVNINAIPGLSKTGNTNVAPGKTFKEKIISPLLPYEGDIITEGRWGNSIRFGSSFDTSKVNTQPNYRGDIGSPIILMSNSIKNQSTGSIVENVQTDASSFYLTSKQQIVNLTTNRPITQNISSVSNFNNSQLIGVADRIVLKSKTDSIIIDAKDKMELNAETIYIGSSTNKEPLLHSTAVVKLLQKLIALVKIGFADSSGVICTPLYDSLPEADVEKLMKELTNDNILVDAYKQNTINT